METASRAVARPAGLKIRRAAASHKVDDEIPPRRGPTLRAAAGADKGGVPAGTEHAPPRRAGHSGPGAPTGHAKGRRAWRT